MILLKYVGTIKEQCLQRIMKGKSATRRDKGAEVIAVNGAPARRDDGSLKARAWTRRKGIWLSGKTPDKLLGIATSMQLLSIATIARFS